MSNDALAPDAPRPPEATWAGTHIFTAPRLVHAASISQVQELVRSEVAAGRQVRALGTRHSFNDIADSAGTLVTVLDIPAEPVLSEDGTTVTVGAGTRYGVVAVWLEERGKALHNMGSLPHISVGGAMSTGTHGSGNGNGVLATAVSGIEYVGADGELHGVRRGDADFDALVVGLGAFGIVVRVTLDVQPTFNVRQDVYRGLPWETLLDSLEEVTGGAYSVSVFTNWIGETIDQIWLKTVVGETPPVIADAWLGSRRDLVATPGLVGGDSNMTDLTGATLAWLHGLPHFRLDATPSNGDEIQTEYFVDRTVAADALRALRPLGPRIEPHLLVTELRTMTADELWLSPAYGRETLAIHFTWLNQPEAVAALIPDIEAALAPFDARPHWGKVTGLPAAEIARVHPRIADARAVFERLDPDGVFANDYLRRVGLR